jgi:ABC-type sugar transport system permease subunit
MLFILPAVVIVFALLVVPFAFELKMSFTNYDILKKTNDFIGLDNYIKLFSDTDFYLALGRNILYVIINVGFNFIIGFGMAYVCYQKFRGNKVVRFIIVLPMLLIPSAAAVLWKFLYNYDIGVINKVLKSIHIPAIPFLISHKLSLISIIFTDIWAWVPWMFLILLAGMEQLEKAPLESARVDGVTTFQLIIHVMIPMMAPVIGVALSLKAIETFRTFDYVWVMTQGGPGKSSDILSTFVFKHAFTNLKIGYSSAMAIAILVIALLLSFFIVKRFIIKRDVE